MPIQPSTRSSYISRNEHHYAKLIHIWDFWCQTDDLSCYSGSGSIFISAYSCIYVIVFVDEMFIECYLLSNII